MTLSISSLTIATVCLLRVHFQLLTRFDHLCFMIL